MEIYDGNYYIDIPDENFLDSENYILNYNLEQFKYLIKQFFIARLLDIYFNKNLGYHFNNELIPIDEYENYTEEFIRIERIYNYEIIKIENLIRVGTCKSIIKKEISDICKKFKIEQKDMQIYIGLLYMIYEKTI